MHRRTPVGREDVSPDQGPHGRLYFAFDRRAAARFVSGVVRTSVVGLTLIAVVACTGPGRYPVGSTPALEKQKLRDLQASPVPAALVGGLDSNVQELAYFTDNAASVTRTLTRAQLTDSTSALVSAVQVAAQNGAEISSVQCLARQISVLALLPIAAHDTIAAPRGWTASLLLSSIPGSLQVTLDIPGGPAQPHGNVSLPAVLPASCPRALRQALRP